MQLGILFFLGMPKLLGLGIGREGCGKSKAILKFLHWLSFAGLREGRRALL